MSITVHPPGTSATSSGAANYARVVDVADAGAQYNSVVAALAAVNSSLTVDNQALVRVFVKEVLEDFTVPDFCHVVGMGDSGVRIKGSANPGGDIVTLSASAALRHCVILPQVNKASAVKIVTGGGPVEDVRLIENVLVSDLTTVGKFTEGVRYEAAPAGLAVYALIDSTISVDSGDALHTVAGSTGIISGLTTSFDSASGKGALIDGGSLYLDGGGVSGATVEVNVAVGINLRGAAYNASQFTGTGYATLELAGTPQLTTETSAYPVKTVDQVILGDASGGIFTVTLPPALQPYTGQIFTIKKIDATANAVTVAANGAETIDGVNTQILAAQFDSIRLISDSSQWFII